MGRRTDLQNRLQLLARHEAPEAAIQIAALLKPATSENEP